MFRAALIAVILTLAAPAFAAHFYNGIIFDTKTHVLLRIIVPTDDSELSDPSIIGQGESIDIVLAAPASISSIQAGIIARHGPGT